MRNDHKHHSQNAAVYLTAKDFRQTARIFCRIELGSSRLVFVTGTILFL